jgi:hypothetical protein
MTDIKPQWRILVMTENFGPVGIGWKYTIEKLWTERTDDAHVCAFALINLSIKHDGEWSAPIPGIGGSMLLVQETKGTHTSDEAYKMAVTDALSVAMKALGVGADVYMGYSDSKNPTQGQQQQGNQSQGNSSDKPWFNDFNKQRDNMIDRIGSGEQTAQHIIDALSEKYKLSNKTKDDILALDSGGDPF